MKLNCNEKDEMLTLNKFIQHFFLHSCLDFVSSYVK